MSAREITSHKVNGLNDKIEIVALDEPGDGGANHDYQIKLVDGGFGLMDPAKASSVEYYAISFQNGPVKKSGFNGISNESLLAIVEDRLKGFQSGKFACRENAIALTKVQEAMHWLHHRTRERLARGVEGTHEK